MENKIETEFDSFLDDILKTLILLIPNAQTGSIQVRDGNEIRYCTAYGYDLKKLQQCVFDKDNFVLKKANNRKLNPIKNLFEVDQLELDPEQTKILVKYGKIETIKCMINFSLLIENEVWGYINIENHYNENAFSEKDIEIVSKFRDITEKVIEAKLAHKKIDAQFNKLYSNIDKYIKLYDMYRHNLRNELQIQLMILGLNNDPTKDEIQNKIKKLDELGKNLSIDEPLAIMPTKRSERRIKNIIIENHLNFTFLAGARIRMYHVDEITSKRRTIICQNFIVDSKKYPEVSDISYSFPLFQNYYIEILLYFDDIKNESDIENNTFIERQLILLYLLNLQKKLFDFFYTRLNETKILYNSLKEFYTLHITPITILLDKIKLKGEKYEEKWLNSICNTNEVISAIKNLLEW